MDCTLHHVCLWLRDYNSIPPRQSLPMPKEAQFALLLRGNTCCGPFDMGPLLYFHLQGHSSVHSRLVDRKVCTYRLSHRLIATIHQHRLRCRHYITVDAYRRHRSQSTYRCIKGGILPHCERFIDGKHCLFYSCPLWRILHSALSMGMELNLLTIVDAGCLSSVSPKPYRSRLGYGMAPWIFC